MILLLLAKSFDDIDSFADVIDFVLSEVMRGVVFVLSDPGKDAWYLRLVLLAVATVFACLFVNDWYQSYIKRRERQSRSGSNDEGI